MEYSPEEQAENRRSWIAALTDGRYRQGRYHLHTSNSFCCIGVACDIGDFGRWKKEGPFPGDYSFMGNINPYLSGYKAVSD